MKLTTIAGQISKKGLTELRKANALIDWYNDHGKRDHPITFRPRQAGAIADAMKSLAKREKRAAYPPLSECTFRGHPIRVGSDT